MKSVIVLFCLTVMVSGCASLSQDANTVMTEGFNHVYKEYVVGITSDPPGSRIEWNGQDIGTTPLKRILDGMRGMAAPAVIKAYSPCCGNCCQVRKIAGNEPIPREIHFDWN